MTQVAGVCELFHGDLVCAMSHALSLTDHLARISTAVAVADATTLLLAAAAMSFKLSVGVVP